MPGFASMNPNEMTDDEISLPASIKVAFDDSELQERIHAAIAQNRALAGLFEDIAQNFMHSRGQGAGYIPTSPSKKRKLDDGSSQTPTQPHANGTSSTALQSPQTVFSCKDVSFQIPMRKKLRLDLAADASNPSRQAIRLVNQTSNETEYTLRADQIEQALCMGVPDKQARQTNFVLYPKAEEGAEPVVFALNEAAPAAGVLTGEGALEEGDTYASVTEKALNRMLGPNGVKLVKPTDAEFASAIPQSHRKGEKGYHVRAHRGSKEGYLFFLPTGIFFGFKKPLVFFPFHAIDSISYTSILQRTFNLVVSSLEPSDGNDAEMKETEFSMLDQADFAGIDEYVKRHGLNDASMAAQRRAKAYNVNKVKQEDGQVGGVGEADGEGESELAKAEQALQDAEDEEEEDYEASGGESDGEGEESEDEEDGEGEGEEREYDDDDDAEGEEL